MLVKYVKVMDIKELIYMEEIMEYCVPNLLNGVVIVVGMMEIIVV
jgi:hypothetical protein